MLDVIPWGSGFSYMPHGQCYLWQSGLVGLHAVADSFIAIAYYSIPLLLIYFIRQRDDLPFKNIFWCFGGFIISCGTTHLLAVWTLWHPLYWLSGGVKAITAIASLWTVLALIPVIPKALALPNPVLELEAANFKLTSEIKRREQIEIQLARSNAELAEQAQTLEAYTVELKRSNQELEQFASVASHDLQEPLRAISGYSQLLVKRYSTQLDPKGRKYLDYILESSHHITCLIEDLLTYARLNRQENCFKSIEVKPILTQVLNNLQVLIQQNQATITHDPLPCIYADPRQIEQLLQNLLSNGIKFRRDIPPKIHITVTETEEEWKFRVEDNGIGIERDFFERIFALFQRLHPWQEYSGTGIGLAICKNAVVRHQGKIWVESEVGQGSVFSFTLRKMG